MNIVKITDKNINLLESFIISNQPKHFRYFDKRDISCIINHFTTNDIIPRFDINSVVPA